MNTESLLSSLVEFSLSLYKREQWFCFIWKWI